MSTITLTDLAHVAGEVLPPRTVLSTVTTPFNNAGGGPGGSSSSSSGAAAAAAAGGDAGSNGTTAISACQGTVSQGTPGLLGSLGLGSNNPGSTFTCVPAAISGH